MTETLAQGRALYARRQLVGTSSGVGVIFQIETRPPQPDHHLETIMQPNELVRVVWIRSAGDRTVILGKIRRDTAEQVLPLIRYGDKERVLIEPRRAEARAA